MMLSDHLHAGKSRIESPFDQFREAFSQFNERETLQPFQLMDQAESLLEERFGPSDQTMVRAYARGQVGLITHHTLYFAGRGILVSLTKGTAIAMRRSSKPASRIVFEGHIPRRLTCPPDDLNSGEPLDQACQMIESLLIEACGVEAPLDISVVSNLETDWVDSFFAALAEAIHRAADLLKGRSGEPTPPIQAAVNSLGRPISPAIWYPAEGLIPGSLLLFDTKMGIQDVLASPPRTELVWGLVDLMQVPSVHDHTKRTKVAQLLDESRSSITVDWGQITQPQLNASLQAVPRRHRGRVRHLLNEHHRVSPMASAIKRGDWQYMGGILFMSHHSLKTEWEGSNERADLIIEQVEALSTEGMYGACKMASHETVLLAGQPLAVQRCLEQIRHRFKLRFDETPRAILL